MAQPTIRRLGILFLVATFAAIGFPSPAAFAAGGDWSTYLFNASRAGDNAAAAVNANNASTLHLQWTHHAGGAVSSQPIVSGSLGLVFWGSWDGYEHATSLSNNAFVWGTFLGKTTDTACDPPVVGVNSTASLGTINSVPVVYVGGGNDSVYALNASTGAIIWQRSLGSSPDYFLWSSPVLYNGSLYIGNASFGDCPLVGGQLVQLNATTGAIQHTFNVVPSGCTGGGVWGSPTIDTAANALYFATGNQGNCSVAEPYAEAVVKLSTASLALLDSWQVRGSDKADLDFGSTPTLFSATINGTVSQLVGIGNKDGTYYALNRSSLHQGTVWRTNVAHTGSCPQCGGGTISPSAWDGTSLYVAGGGSSINGVACQGTLQALNPATGAFRWRHCLGSGPVLGAVSVAGSPSVVFVGQGTFLMGIAAANGQTVFRFNDSSSGSMFWGAASIANSAVYIGNQDGSLFSLSL